MALKSHGTIRVTASVRDASEYRNDGHQRVSLHEQLILVVTDGSTFIVIDVAVILRVLRFLAIHALHWVPWSDNP